MSMLLLLMMMKIMMMLLLMMLMMMVPLLGGGVGGGGCGGGGGHDAHGCFFCHDLCSHALWKAYTLATRYISDSNAFRCFGCRFLVVMGCGVFSGAPGNPELESHNQLES